MKKNKSKKSAIFLSANVIALSGMLLSSTSAFAQFYETEKFKATATVKNQFLYEDNRSLGQTKDDDTTSFSVEGRIQTEYSPSDRAKFYLDARGVALTGDLFEDSVTGETLQAEEFLQLRQAWFSYDLDEQIENTSIKVGRQRIREGYGIWWNNDQDAITAKYDTTQFQGFAGIGQNLYSYNTADDEFRGSEKERFRAFAEGSWMTPFQCKLDLRAMYENDHSGTPDVGTNLTRDERDDEDGQLFWVGARIENQKNEGSKDKPFLAYRADVIGVTGQIEDITTVSGEGTSRTVSGSNDVDVSGWAFDGQVDYEMNHLPLKPVVTLGYAYGSGDDDNGEDGKSNGFIQSDLHSNTSYDLGSSRPIHNYGEAFRPDLSNLHIIKAGGTLNITDNSDVSLVYRKYRLADEGSQLRSSRARQSVNGDSKDVGQGVDFVFNSNIAKELKIDVPALSGLSFRSSLGVFKSGDAYANTSEDETMIRGLAEIQIKF